MVSVNFSNLGMRVCSRPLRCVKFVIHSNFELTIFICAFSSRDNALGKKCGDSLARSLRPLTRLQALDLRYRIQPALVVHVRVSRGGTLGPPVADSGGSGATVSAPKPGDSYWTPSRAPPRCPPSTATTAIGCSGPAVSPPSTSRASTSAGGSSAPRSRGCSRGARGASPPWTSGRVRKPLLSGGLSDFSDEASDVV